MDYHESRRRSSRRGGGGGGKEKRRKGGDKWERGRGTEFKDIERGRRREEWKGRKRENKRRERELSQ